MLKQIRRFWPGVSDAQWYFDKFSTNWPFIATVFVGGGGMTYLAKISLWLAPWGPIAWGAIGLCSSLIIALLIMSFVKIRNINVNSRYISAVIERPKNVNPLRDNFEKEKILLSDFYSPFSIHNERKTFKNCEIHGPGSLLMAQRSNLIGPHMHQCDMIIFDPTKPVQSAVIFSETSFFECKFFNLSLMLVVPNAQQIVDDCARRGREAPAFHGVQLTPSPMQFTAQP